MQVGTNNAANNSVKIDSTFVTAFNSEPAGTTFTPSVVVNYGNNITITTSPASGVPNFVPLKIASTLFLANTLNKLSTDSAFSLSNFITTNSPGVLSYSSSDANVAEVDSSGQVTLKGVVGTTTISVTQAASNDGRYAAASAVSRQLVVRAPPISLAANGVTIQYTPAVGYFPPSFPWFIQANPRGTGTELFAVVDQAAKSAITSYAKNQTIGINYFKPQGQSNPISFNNIVTTLMTDMGSMFNSAHGFNYPIGSWDTQNVTNMGNMFTTAITFNQPIGSWDTQNVTTMGAMFDNARAFNQSIGSWNVSNVTNMYGMFYNTPFNQPIGTWNTSKVTTMMYMFYAASRFNQDISSWQVYRLQTRPYKPTDFDTGATALLASHFPDWAMSAPVV
jgi:surface protein